MWQFLRLNTISAIYFNNVVIIVVKGNDYRIHFWYMCKDETK